MVDKGSVSSVVSTHRFCRTRQRMNGDDDRSHGLTTYENGKALRAGDAGVVGAFGGLDALGDFGGGTTLVVRLEVAITFS